MLIVTPSMQAGRLVMINGREYLVSFVSRVVALVAVYASDKEIRNASAKQ